MNAIYKYHYQETLRSISKCIQVYLYYSFIWYCDCFDLHVFTSSLELSRILTFHPIVYVITKGKLICFLNCSPNLFTFWLFITVKILNCFVKTLNIHYVNFSDVRHHNLRVFCTQVWQRQWFNVLNVCGYSIYNIVEETNLNIMFCNNFRHCQFINLMKLTFW